MTKLCFPEIPKTWLIAVLMIGLIVMRCFGIDSFTTAGLGMIIGFITGKQMERAATKTTNQK